MKMAPPIFSLYDCVPKGNHVVFLKGGSSLPGGHQIIFLRGSCVARSGCHESFHSGGSGVLLKKNRIPPRLNDNSLIYNTYPFRMHRREGFLFKKRGGGSLHGEE